MLGICSDLSRRCFQLRGPVPDVHFDLERSASAAIITRMKYAVTVPAVLLAIALICGAGLAAPTTAPTTAPAGQGDDKLAPATCGKIARVSRLADVYLAGQPSAEDLAEAKKLGIKTVINLRPDSETKEFKEREA